VSSEPTRDQLSADWADSNALTPAQLRQLQAEALRTGVGVLAAKDYPEWSTPEAISAWVAAQRRDREGLAAIPDEDTGEHVLSG
jgi:hypothetical protein